MTFAFDNSYAALPEHFYARLPATPVKAPKLIKVNRALAHDLKLDADFLESEAGVAILAGNAVPAGSAPLAAAYAGHQFGHFVPQLGDGRAILLGEVIGRDGTRRDIQLKGAGQTPYSRRGDGRAALGPVLREYIVSEAMAALGIPTTRTLAAVLTGEYVLREDGPLPGAVLTRVAASHIRVGTFQFFAARGDTEGVRTLADHVIARHYPEIKDAANPYVALLEGVTARQAKLIAQWLLVGFIHGVMNTDNMAVAGETIDYGPCAFMDAYRPDMKFSSIDQRGRYAYANQPPIALWNLTRFAETLLPLIDRDQEAAVKRASDALNTFGEIFEAAYKTGFARKLGLAPSDAAHALGQDLLGRMAHNAADFTLTFRGLCGAAEGDSETRALFETPGDFDAWEQDWRKQLALEPMRGRKAAMEAVNPAFIPRNHRVEEAIQAAMTGDFRPFETLTAVLAKPYADQPDYAAYMAPPRPEEIVRETFCGT
ncbi:MAG: YdiU family protein [Rhodospirillaceae bacterium]|nr:YdiU family protein [Rhodospirillaceae bacterium]